MPSDVLAIHAEAEGEVETAFSYLEEERPGHGYVFLERYRELIEEAIRLPGLGIRLPDYPEALDVRKHVMKQFSYSLIIATVRGQRTIVALQLHRNREDYWRNRLE